MNLAALDTCGIGDLAATFLEDASNGLRSIPKTLPCKYFYDEAGSKLFDRICDLDEYYLTRTEIGILRQHAPEMARWVGPEAALVELGSGSSLKTRLLLDVLERPAVYVPVDISGEHMAQAASSLASAYPGLKITPVVADFVQTFALPPEARAASRRVAFFPGSTIGNFDPAQVVVLLRKIRRLVGRGGGLLIGVDLRKDPAILEPAYDDALGVTADFNLNILRRLNQELGADFDLDAFRHLARFNPVESRVEMHLKSLRDQVVTICDETFAFAEGETIHTESSYKYTPEKFADLVANAGFSARQVWTDPAGYFSVQALSAE